MPDTVTDPRTDPRPAPPIDDAVAVAVRGTVLDYFEGWFDGDPDRMTRALHPLLAKRARPRDPARALHVATLTAEQMIAATAAGEGAADARAGRAIVIEIVDVATDIASVVVRSATYDEYLHLVSTPDGWRIINALWRYADGHDPAD